MVQKNPFLDAQKDPRVVWMIKMTASSQQQARADFLGTTSTMPQYANGLKAADPATVVWGSSIDDKNVGVYTRFCYLDLSRHRLQGLSTKEIATALDTNEAPGPPLGMRRMSRTVVRLFYKSKADRDQVIATGVR